MRGVSEKGGDLDGCHPSTETFMVLFPGFQPVLALLLFREIFVPECLGNAWPGWPLLFTGMRFHIFDDIL